MRESHEIHISKEDMQRYVSGTLGEEERERVDLALQDCEQCLALLMGAMDEEWSKDAADEHGLPLPDLHVMEDRVIAELKLEQMFASAELAKLAETSKLTEMAKPAETSMPDEMARLAETSKPAEMAKPAMPTKSEILNRPDLNSKPAARRISWIQKPAWQYTIAASITLLLLASGALAGFSQSLEKLDESNVAMPSPSDIGNAWSDGPSWSEQLVNRTGSWLDGIQESRFK